MHTLISPLRFLSRSSVYSAISFSPAVAREENRKNPTLRRPSPMNQRREDKEKEEEEPKLSVSEHTVNINGKPMKYKATAGYIF